jgi:hypothetical protein
LEICSEILTVEYEILTLDRLPISEDGITDGDFTLSAFKFDYCPSIVMGDSESSLVPGNGLDSSWRLFTHDNPSTVIFYDSNLIARRRPFALRCFFRKASQGGRK